MTVGLHRFFRWLMPILLGLLGVGLVWALSQQMEWGIFDVYTRWAARQDARQQKLTPSPVELVLIDDASIERLKGVYGLPPWPRSAYIDIFKRLQQYKPAVLAFDGHFMYFQQKDDAKAFDALRRIPRLVLGMVYMPDSHADATANQWRNSQAANYYLLNLGVVNVQQNPNDGLLRGMQTIWMPSRHTPGVFPSLSISAALAFLRHTQPELAWVLDWEARQKPILTLLSESKPDASRHFQLEADGSMLLHWRPLLNEAQMQAEGLDTAGLAISHRATPLWQLIDAADARRQTQLAKRFDNKILLLGSASHLHQDFHHTPLSIHHCGADIQATAIDNFLGLQPIRVAPGWLGNGLSAVLFLGMAMLRLRTRKLDRCVLYTLGSMAIYACIAFWWFWRQQFWLPVVTPELMMVLGFIFASAWLSLAQDKEVALLEGHLSRLVSQSVFQEIRQMSRIITQGGRKLEITAMMVDIRNFTSMAESLTPQQVSGLLNEFYETVVTVVFNYRGTVDKFLGDGVLILFGAPLPDNRHAEDALQAALALLEQSERLTAKWREERGIETEIGISLHSGNAFVGFIGPKNKLEYTAIGDTVNLCARLQEQAKAFQTPLIISQNTLDYWQKCLAQSGSDLETPSHAAIQQCLRSLGLVTVRGRETAIEIWTVQQ